MKNRYEVWVTIGNSSRLEQSTSTLQRAKAEAVGIVNAYKRQQKDANAKVYDMLKNDDQGSQGVLVFTA